MDSNRSIIFDKFIQVKMLILFSMSLLPYPISMEQLTELTMCDDRISYFDITECVEKLVKTKHLLLENGKYTLTAKGMRNGKILEDDLPHSVKVKAEEAASRIRKITMRDSLIKTSYTENGKGGFDVGLSLSDGVSSILSMGLHAANKQQAELIEKGFRKNAQSLYHDILDLLMK